MKNFLNKVYTKYFVENKEQLKNLKVNTCNPIKDTFEYFIIQCNKTEWIREAISLNLFEISSNFFF